MPQSGGWAISLGQQGSDCSHNKCKRVQKEACRTRAQCLDGMKEWGDEVRRNGSGGIATGQFRVVPRERVTIRDVVSSEIYSRVGIFRRPIRSPVPFPLDCGLHGVELIALLAAVYGLIVLLGCTKSRVHDIGCHQWQCCPGSTP